MENRPVTVSLPPALGQSGNGGWLLWLARPQTWRGCARRLGGEVGGASPPVGVDRVGGEPGHHGQRHAPACPPRFPAGRPAPWGPGATRKMGPPFRSVPVPEGPRNQTCLRPKSSPACIPVPLRPFSPYRVRIRKPATYLSGKSPEFGY